MCVCVAVARRCGFSARGPLLECVGSGSQVLDGAWPYLVACSAADSAVVGYAYAKQFRERSAYRYTVEDSIYRAPGYGRRGIGRMLLAELIARCRGLGAHSIVAFMSGTAETNPGSYHLHTSLGARVRACRGVGHAHARHAGFEEMCRFREVGFRWGRWVDTTGLQLML